MRYCILIGLFLMLLSLPSVAVADPVTLDFEGLADGTHVTNQFLGLTFTNATAITAGVSLNEFEFPPHSGVNVVFDDGGPMTITFASPVTSFGGYFTHTVRLTLSAFDASNNLLASITSVFSNNLALSGDLGSSPNEFLSFSFASGISRITIVGDPTGGSFTLDDVTINGPTAAVPEPGTILLFLTGSAALIRYRKRC